MRNALVASSLFLLLGLPAARAQDGMRWRMSVAVTPPRPVAVLDADRRSQAYWWCEIALTNDSGAARSLSLSARAIPDAGAVSYASFRTDVAEAVARELGRPADNALGWTGELAAGETKRGVLIFPAVDPLADRLDVRVGGAHSAVRREGDAWYSENVEHSTVFARPGEEYRVWNHAVGRAAEDWVVVSRKKFRG